MNRLIRSRWSSLHAGILSLVFLMLSMAMSSSARAGNWKVVSNHTLTYNTAGWKYVTVQRLTTDTLTVYARIAGSSRFQASTTALRWRNDTTYRDSLQSLAISFSTNANDSSYGAVILTDGTTTDTVTLFGYDTTYAHSYTEDFFLSPHLIRFGTSNDSSGQWLSVRNLQHQAIRVDIRLIGDSAWHLGYSSIQQGSLPLGASTSDNVRVVYQSIGSITDTALVIFTCSSPYAQADTAILIVNDSSIPRSRVHLNLSQLDLGIVEVGDSVCGAFRIENPSTSTVTISALSLSPGSDAGWSWSGVPSTPLTLGANSATTFSVCYSRQALGSSYLPVSVQFTDNLGRTGDASGYVRAGSHACIEADNDSVRLSDVIVGGYVDVSVRYIIYGALDSLNLRVGYDSLNELSVISPHFPLTVHRGDTVIVHYRFTPAYARSYVFKYAYLTSGNCGVLSQIVGKAVDSSSTVGLFGGESDLLALRSEQSTVTKTFTFHNDALRTVRVTGMQLTDGSHFQIVGYSPHSLPDTLSSGADMSVDVQFQGNQNGFYYDSLIVTTDNMLQSLVFRLEAVREGAASVHRETAASRAALHISPNPAQGPVKIAVTGAQEATIQIYDLLGNTIEQRRASTGFDWSGAGLNPAGIYIVRAAGVDIVGRPFVLSQRVALEK